LIKRETAKMSTVLQLQV